MRGRDMDPVSPSGPASPEKHHRISGYEILGKIGEGGMGVVFRARQVSLDRIVALKVLAPKLAADERLIERFFQEAKVIARLSHPHIVRIYEVDRSKGGIYYYAMEYVEGQSVGKLLKSRGKLGIPEAVRIGAQISRALAHAHENGLVHRDVKPDNILLAKDGTAKLADLGLARSFQQESSPQTTSGSIVGTPYYMAPEQAEAKGVNARSDLYSLGATLYHCVVGAPPFMADSAIGVITKHLTDPRPDPRTLNPGVPPALAAVIGKLLQIDPAERYASAKEVAQALEAILERRSALARRGSASAPAGWAFWKRPAVAGALVGLLALAFVGSWVRSSMIDASSAREFARADALWKNGQGPPTPETLEALQECKRILEDLIRRHPKTRPATSARARLEEASTVIAMQQSMAVRSAETELMDALQKCPHAQPRPAKLLGKIAGGLNRLGTFSQDPSFSQAARDLAARAQKEQRERLSGYYESGEKTGEARGALLRQSGREKTLEFFQELLRLLPPGARAVGPVEKEIRELQRRMGRPK